MTEDQALTWFMAIAGTIILGLLSFLAILIVIDMYLWIGLWGVAIPVAVLVLLSNITRRLYAKIEDWS